MEIIFEGICGNDSVYMSCLKAICGETKGKSMIDLCCNLAPHTPLLGFEKRKYVDVLHRTLDHAEEQQYFMQDDVLSILKHTQDIFDVSICSDGIEHLTDENGILLLKLMAAKSFKQVLFTPFGEHMVDRNSTDPEGHHSGWTPRAIEKLFPKNFAFITFPNYHPTLGVGAFFFWRCVDIEKDFDRVCSELKNVKWE